MEKGSRWFDLHDGGWSYFVNRLVQYCQTGRVESRAMFREPSDIERAEKEAGVMTIEKNLFLEKRKKACAPFSSFCFTNMTVMVMCQSRCISSSR